MAGRHLPGCACDIPSHLYSFSFAPNPDWAHSFSRQPEIWDYLEHVADRYRLRGHLRLGTEVAGARWDAGRARWQLRTSHGDLTADVLISAAGPLSEPRRPDIPGLAAFPGPVFHSARWNHGARPDGQRVAVVGTGASAIQIVPEIQPKVASLVLLRRTPAWVLPRRDRVITGPEKWVYRHVPPAQQLARLGNYLAREPAFGAFVAQPGGLKAAQRIALRHLARSVADPVLRAKLTPRYVMGCKRILLSSDFYPALVRPNVEVAGAGLARVDGRTVIAGDGTARDVDVILLATGFRAVEAPIADRIAGADGRTLAQAWGGDMRALGGTTVPGFPNLCLVIGPNTGFGHSSMIRIIESQLRYILDYLAALDRTGAVALDARPGAQERWCADIERRMATSVWTTGGCVSWYLNAAGRNPTLWPGSTLRFRRATRHLDLSEYRVIMPGGRDSKIFSGHDWKYGAVSVVTARACRGWFVGGGWCAGCMPRRRGPGSPPVVHRTARAGLRVTRAQRRRLVELLVSAGDVWACVLELNAWRRARQDRPLVSYQEPYRELAASGPGCFGELDSAGTRSVLRRYSDAWFAAAQRRRKGDQRARFPRRRRALMPVRWYYGTFTLEGRRLRIPVARGQPPLWVRLDRDLPYPPDQVRSVTLLYDAGRLWVDVTAEVPVACYRAGQEPDPSRVAGVDLGIIHPYAVAGPDGQGLLVSGRAIRAEHRMHLADSKARRRAVARRAPMPGQKRSRRWRHYRRRQRLAEARHRRRVRQAQHEAATAVIAWAVDRRVGRLAVGDPRGVLNLKAGRRHNQRTRDWRIGHLIAVLADKAEAAGISLALVDERGTSSTCPACQSRIPKPPGRVLACPACLFTGHRDLAAAANIAARNGGGTTPASLPADVTHRRAGAHLPGVSPSRRDPRRRAHHRSARGSPGRHRPAPPA